MGLLASSQLLTSLFLVGLALTAAGLLMRASRRLARRTSAAEPIVDSRHMVEPRGPNTAGPPAELTQWEVQMHETARDLSGRLASRISALQALVAEADRAAARLEAALAEARRLAARADTHRGASTQASGLRASGFENSDALPAAGAQRQMPQPAQEATDGASSAHRPRSGNGEASPAPRCSQQPREEICLLSDYGFEPAEIARRTSTPLGEVELILSLRPRD